jgi:hypothetical protein
MDNVQNCDRVEIYLSFISDTCLLALFHYDAFETHTTHMQGFVSVKAMRLLPVMQPVI